MRLLICLLSCSSCVGRLSATPWVPFGPDGGDARRFAPDPHDPRHIYLGTANGWLYETSSGGAHWRRLGRPGRRDDLVLDGIFVDPTDVKHLVVGAWAVGAKDGGLFTSNDAGMTWTDRLDMKGKAVLALTAAPSDPKMMVAGTLQGVYRSADGGQSWKMISPLDSTEIHDVQSVAVDPKDPNIIFVGTWHLPWKSVDGGANWFSIKQGIIEDSDVFSIIVDPHSPRVVFASACSGIYKSEDGGEGFRKVQGIPSSARRTRVLLQDPGRLSTVFAGTTEGLFRSQDGGKDWSRTTDSNIIVNDVFVDARDSKHVLIATDRGGVLASDDAGNTFQPSNGGFSARQITALKTDASNPSKLFVGVANDKEFGGVFESDNGGIDWRQRSSGLEGKDVFALGQAPDGTLLAGTNHGIFRLSSEESVWDRIVAPPAGTPVEANRPLGLTRPPVTVKLNQFGQRTGLTSKTLRGTAITKPFRMQQLSKENPERPSKAGLRRVPRREMRGGISIATRQVAPINVHQTAASTNAISGTIRAGAESKASPETLPAKSFNGAVLELTTSDSRVLATTSSGLLTSEDNGLTWNYSGPPASSEWRYLASAKRNVVAASLQSISFSSDSGVTWTGIKAPEPLSQITCVAVEPSGAIWAGGREGVFVSSDGGSIWTTPKNLFLTSVTSVYFDEHSGRILLTTVGTHDLVFTVELPSRKVSYAESGWNLRFVRMVGDHFVGATFFDGVVIQPRMDSTPERKESASLN